MRSSFLRGSTSIPEIRCRQITKWVHQRCELALHWVSPLMNVDCCRRNHRWTPRAEALLFCRPYGAPEGAPLQIIFTGGELSRQSVLSVRKVAFSERRP